MRRVRAGLVTLGVVVMLVAVAGGLRDDDLSPGGVVVFLGGVLVAHDGVFMPLIIAAGALTGRWVPGAARAAVRFAAVVTAAVTVVAVPLLTGAGRVAGDPSVLPRSYPRGLAVVLATVWAVAAAVVVAGRRRTVRDPQAPDGDAGADGG